MAKINRIEAHIRTADVSHAGTQGWVYLGIAGREFVLDAAGTSSGTRTGDNWTFVLGEDANVENAAYNDPRRPQLYTDNLDRYPVYLRFEPIGPDPAWCLERVVVDVNPDTDHPQTFDNPDLADFGEDRRLWLGQEYGKCLFLKRYND
ncbi:hypothetical protein ACFPM3_18620 [Streptomyces coeruleoprunus]|uniref:PLAT domain-containing protein n=1 Tax=Streptomyces coeruleoprunus TaxID=285563 RepID=A0ABV9XKR9_9ACTN